MDGTVLIADDDRTIRTVLTQAFTRAGCKVHATSSVTTLMRWVSEQKGDLVITDVMMPDGNGLDALSAISKNRPNLPVIVISAQNTMMTAVKAAELNAFDYLPKPFDLPELMKKASNALSQRKTVSTPAAALDDYEALPLVGSSEVMQNVYKTVARILNVDLNIMISGQSGTGKTLVARSIHDLSDRRNLPFVVVQADTHPDADQFSAAVLKAKGGTILFEGIANSSPDFQARLSHFIESDVDTLPRILTTFAGDAQNIVEEGAIREDLFFRLNGIQIELPSLDKRRGDIGPLIHHFLGQLDRQQAVTSSISEDAIRLFETQNWPGNVRQLKNAAVQIALVAAGNEITKTFASDYFAQSSAFSSPVTETESGFLSDAVATHVQRYFDLHGANLPPAGVYQRILKEVEIPLLQIVLDATSGNQAKCAELLGINRNTLRKKLSTLEIEVTRRRKMM